MPEGDNILVGRGQHCNLSLWMGNNNLFAAGKNVGHQDLVNHAVKQSLQWLPFMFLPSRHGNYARIAARGVNAVQEFSAEKLGRDKNKYILRYTDSDGDRPSAGDAYARLEFRQGASEADPLDLAVASAAPLVKACDEVIKKKDGKAILDSSGHLDVLPSQGFPFNHHEPVPKSAAEAAVPFNAVENPYFEYLNQLAERKIARAQAEYDRDRSALNNEALRDARKLAGIGTQLRGIYTREYGVDGTGGALSRRGQQAGRDGSSQGM